MILNVQNLEFSYRKGIERTVCGVSLQIGKGDFVAIQGPSGSGKSTLFYLLGGLLRPDSGHIILDGVDLTACDEAELAWVRNRRIGFVFQQFHLLAKATVWENILLPAQYPAEIKKESSSAKDKAKQLAERVGLLHKLNHLPNQLSGGEQQRVAIARSLMHDPDCLLADEPTGNIDSQNTAAVMALFRELNAQGTTIIVITHDDEIASQCRTSLTMRDGKILGASPPKVVDSPEKTNCGKVPRGPLPTFRALLSTVPQAWANLKRNKIRALLNMTGVTVGIAAVLAMITFGEFVRLKILQGYEDLGVNKLVIHGWPNWRRKATDRVDVIFRNFDWDKDVLSLHRVFPEIQLSSPVHNEWNNTLHFGGKSMSDKVRALGVNADYLAISNREITAGRVITPHHVDEKSPVCLIGSEIKEKLFDRADPVGGILFVAGDANRPPYPCQIIGVLASQVSNVDWRNPNFEVILPHSYFSSVNDFWSSALHQFTLKLRSGGDVEATSRGIKAYLRNKYGNSGEFVVGADSILMAQMKKFLALFGALLTSVALISLAVGGVGIHNLMLVSLSERFKEIGLRKALGATHRTIRLQFLTESVGLCLVAGMMGIAIGFAAYELIIFATSKIVPKLSFEWIWDPVAVGASLLSILVVGVLSGIVPAIKAERLQIIEALRSE